MSRQVPDIPGMETAEASSKAFAEAFEAMREALRAATTERPKTDLPSALAVLEQCRAALALADKVKP